MCGWVGGGACRSGRAALPTGFQRARAFCCVGNNKRHGCARGCEELVAAAMAAAVLVVLVVVICSSHALSAECSIWGAVRLCGGAMNPNYTRRGSHRVLAPMWPRCVPNRVSCIRNPCPESWIPMQGALPPTG